MFRDLVYFVALTGLAQNALFAQGVLEESLPATPEQIFSQGDESSILAPIAFQEPISYPTASCVKGGTSCDSTLCDSCSPTTAGCDSITGCDDGWCRRLLNAGPLLSEMKNQKMGPFTYSIGGALRYRFIDERNRLRPPLTGRQSSYNQWRFTPNLEIKYGDTFTGFVEGIDAPTFGEDLPDLPIDENRFDLLQYYADIKIFDSGRGEKIRVRAGRQFLKYGSQHLVSPLGWSNTFRNFEGVKLYYTSDNWNIDAFATRPVNGATGNTYRPNSFDTPDQSRWFSGVYGTYKKAPKGTFDLYWLWLDEDADRADRIDGNRHTFGARYAGKQPLNNECGDPWTTLGWDLEGAFQVGRDIVGAGPAKDVRAGFISTNTGLTFNQVPWTPTLSGVFFWGSGDNDPNDGTTNTVSTLFPLGHAYWGLIDNFSGQNLLDYSAQISVKPTKKLTCLAAWHWFDKAQSEDAIWNIAGAPYGGIVPTASRNLGNELDLLATYAATKNVTLQAGYFWFFYGDAVNNHPVGAVANRGDAKQFYFLTNWKF